VATIFIEVDLSTILTKCMYLSYLRKYPRNLIDIELYQNRVYYAREDGTIKVMTFSSDLKTVKDIKSFQTE
jgi:hypothetical protein